MKWEQWSITYRDRQGLRVVATYAVTRGKPHVTIRVHERKEPE